MENFVTIQELIIGAISIVIQQVVLHNKEITIAMISMRDII